MRTTDLYCDVLVAGGGPAGVPCALAAARNGAKVILCQNRSVLGGNASSEVRMHIVGADCSGGRGEELMTEAREGGIIEEIRLETGVQNPQRSASMLDLIFYNKCREEENLTLLLNTTVTGVEVEKEIIKKAIAERQSTEEGFNIYASVFIDCTGDGRLGKEAKAPFRSGRESKDEFNEDWAQETTDEKRQGSSLLFQARKMDEPVKFQAPSWARTFTEDDLKLRPHASGGVDRGLEYGYWWTEWGGTLDTIQDNEEIRDELLAIMMGVWDHIKNGGDHGADNWALDWFGFLPGKRESRRFIGKYTLTEADLLESRPQSDAIAFGGWRIDMHPPEGIDATDVKPTYGTKVPHLFDIPLSACVSSGPDNLMFAGRNMSATHVAFASTRVMATCAAVGQGVGTAAGHAIRNNLTPAELLEHPDDIKRVQQNLLRDDAYMLGIRNEDEGDMAPLAAVHASSEQEIGKAANILSGQSRSTHGSEGAPEGRTLSGSNRWMSVPEDGLPAWIELRWGKPVQLGEIRLIFDTGMHRPLTLTHSDDYVKKMAWGRPQPETVKHYTIEGFVDGKWRILTSESDNFQRLRIHQWDDAPTVQRLRINILETQGMNHARICEVRVY